MATNLANVPQALDGDENPGVKASQLRPLDQL